MALGHRPGHPQRSRPRHSPAEVNSLNDRSYFRNLPLTSGAAVRLANAIREKADVEDLRQGS